MPKPTLEGLLPEELRKDLTPAEKILLVKAQKGKSADFRSGDKETDRPENAKKWKKDRIVRAGLLYWLCVDREASELVHAKGVRIYGAKVEGPLDFEAATLSHPLWLVDCAIPEEITLRGAQTRTIGFSGSHTGPISADGLTTQGAVFLRGTHAKGEVRLLGANIGGPLSCTGATFNDPKGKALTADGLITQGSVFLRGTQAKGAVSLVSADIKGSLECEGATFENPGGEALAADRLTTQGAVFLRDGFQAKGQVRLLSANIGGVLDCEGATFENPGGEALNADRLITQGSVFLRGTQTKGAVSLAGADIKGSLDCDGATFENLGGEALSVETLLVKGGLFWRSMKERPIGAINLLHAKVGRLVDDAESWPTKDNLSLDGFEYEAFGIESPRTATERLDWLALQPEKPFHPQPYEQLAKVFRQMGHEVNARKVLIAKQDARREHMELGLTKMWLWFLGKTIRYGYEPWRVMVFMVFMILFGWNVFTVADAKGAMIDIKNVPNPFNGFVYSLEVFVPLVDLHQESYWLPDAKATYGGLLRLYFWVHIALGWISSTLLVAALTGLVRKE